MLAGKTNVMPALKRHPPRSTALVPWLNSSTYWSSSLPEMGLYINSLITISPIRMSPLGIPGVGEAMA